MKQIKRNLNTVAKGMKALTKKVEKLQGQLAKMEKAQVKRKAKPKARPKAKPKAKARAKAVKRVAVVRRRAKATAPQILLELIQSNDKGVDTKMLREKTGFDPKKLQVTLFRMKKQGKIKSLGKGLYTKA